MMILDCSLYKQSQVSLTACLRTGWLRHSRSKRFDKLGVHAFSRRLNPVYFRPGPAVFFIIEIGIRQVFTEQPVIGLNGRGLFKVLQGTFRLSPATEDNAEVVVGIGI